MAREVLKAQCKSCGQEHPRTLFAEDGVCLFCHQDKSEQAEETAEKNHIEEEQRRRAQLESRNEMRQEMGNLKNRRRIKEQMDLENDAEFDPQTAAQQEIARRLLSQKHLLPFVCRSNPDYDPGWVHKDICEHLEWFSEAVAAGESPRLAIFMPPRHGKSELASVNFPAWHLGNQPKHEIISCSYSSALALSFSRKVRALARDERFRQVFENFSLDTETQSAELWATKVGGSYRAAGVGGPITGSGANVLIIDDPVKNREEAESENTRQGIWDWYTSTAYTRLQPGGGVLLILTRWHDDDLAGRLMQAMAEEEGDQWRVINYPAIAENDELFRKKGEALHGSRYPLKDLERIKRVIGPRDWSALYQQNPVPDQGAYFTQNMIHRYRQNELSNWDEMLFYTAWDLAVGQKEMNDWSVGITVGVDREDNIYIVDIQRGRWDTLTLVEKILDVYEVWRSGLTGIERGQIEMAVGPLLSKRARERGLSGFNHEPLRPGKMDKVARARSIQGRMAQGRVFFRYHCDITQTLINEMLRFPNGAHDDGVDALAYIGKLLDEFATPRKPKPKRTKSWKDKLPFSGRTGPKGFMTA